MITTARKYEIASCFMVRIDEGKLWKEAVRVMIQGENRRYGFADGSCLERNEHGKYRVVKS